MHGQETSTEITDGVLLAASRSGARLFRQNTGMGWVGKIVNRTKAAITLKNPRPLHAGLCEGSSDIIGITPTVITQAMVGQTVGVFTAVEVKAGQDRLSKPQERFLHMIAVLGGLALTARSSKDYEAISPKK